MTCCSKILGVAITMSRGQLATVDNQRPCVQCGHDTPARFKMATTQHLFFGEVSSTVLYSRNGLMILPAVYLRLAVEIHNANEPQ